MNEKAKNLGRVVVLMGGMSSEREVSLMSGSGVLKALQDSGVDAVAFDPAKDDIEALRNGGFDRAVISLHGRFGEDGTVQGLLEFLQIPYTGPGVRASAIAMDKTSTRAVWAAAGIPIAKGTNARSIEDAERIIEELGGDLVVKPAGEGSSIGVVKLQGADAAELAKALEQALKFDPCVLVEQRIYGREMTVAILDGKALPIIEIIAPEGDYDFNNKYYGDAVRYECPAKLDSGVAAAIAETCEKAFAALGARGWGRIDVMMRDDGSFILLELNTSPGMTSHSLVPMAARTVGLSYADLVMHVAAAAELDNRL